MEINSKPYGKIEINPEDIIHFEKGLVGFDNLHQFVLLGNTEADEMLVWLQSVEKPELAFVVIQPRFFKPDYCPRISAEEVESLSVETEEDILIYAIVVIPEDARKMTANLKAPILINVKNNKAKQIILNDDRYEIKTRVLAAE